MTTVVGQALVLTKGPFDLLRGGPSGEEKLLKNARDEVVTEALEIATYDALEALALAVGDDATARLAARHRGQEERMLEQLRGHIPHLANAVAQARAGGRAELRLGDHGRGRHGPQDGAAARSARPRRHGARAPRRPRSRLRTTTS